MTRLASLVFLSLATATAILLASNSVSSYPEPLTPKGPLGSLIYDPSASGTIGAAGDTASFTLPVNAGQTITLDVRPNAAALQPAVTVFNPANVVIATATAAAPGNDAVVQVVPATTGGTYTFTVSGSGGTAGGFSIQATLNAMLDSGPGNSTLGTAQDINASAVGLTAATDRLAVLGHFDGTDDVYSFAMPAGQSATLALTLATNASVTLQLKDSGGAVLAVGVPGAENVSLSIENFVTPAAGTYYAVVSGSGQSDFSLIVTRGANFDIENNDRAARARDLNPSGVILGAIGNSGNSPDTDWYAFNVNAHQTITTSTTTPSDQGGEFHNSLTPLIDVYDNNLVHVATNAGGSKNAPVVWTALTTGRYFVQLSGANSSTGEYVLAESLSLVPDVTITKTAPPNPVLTGSNFAYTLTVTNIGGAPAANVVVADNLPATTVFVSCSASGGGVCGGSGNSRTITFASLAAGASAQITLNARLNCPVADGARIRNTATVSAAADANPNNNSAAVAIAASNPPPVVSRIGVDKPVLWPPNHKMIPVTVNYAVTDNCGIPGCALAVSSNESVAKKEPDWQIIDAHHVLLRAERAGNGRGRVYTITITCTDSANNQTVRAVVVTVPHDQGKGK